MSPRVYPISANCAVFQRETWTTSHRWRPKDCGKTGTWGSWESNRAGSTIAQVPPLNPHAARSCGSVLRASSQAGRKPAAALNISLVSWSTNVQKIILFNSSWGAKQGNKQRSCIVPAEQCQQYWGKDTDRLVHSQRLFWNQFFAFWQPKRLSARKTGSRAALTLCWFRTKRCLHQGHPDHRPNCTYAVFNTALCSLWGRRSPVASRFWCDVDFFFVFFLS